MRFRCVTGSLSKILRQSVKSRKGIAQKHCANCKSMHTIPTVKCRPIDILIIKAPRFCTERKSGASLRCREFVTPGEHRQLASLHWAQLLTIRLLLGDNHP